METEYVIDDDGNMVMIGLTAMETAEFEMLDKMEAAIIGTIPSGGRDVGATARIVRWQELYEKHVAARMLSSLSATATRH